METLEMYQTLERILRVMGLAEELSAYAAAYALIVLLDEHGYEIRKVDKP